MAKKRVTKSASEYPLDAPHQLEGLSDPRRVLKQFGYLLNSVDAERAASAVGVAREGENAYGTWGYIFVWNGSQWVHQGYTLEPRASVGKGPIPLGTYPFARWMSPTLKKTLRLSNVPGFTDILIHVGNFQSETKGCILAGKKVDTVNNPTQLVDSRTLTDWLYDNCPSGTVQVISL